MLSKKQVQEFMNKPLSAKLISLTENYLRAVNLTEERVIISDKCRAEALNEAKPKYAPLVFKPRGSNVDISETDAKTGTVIERWEELYQSSDDDAEKVYSIYEQKMAANGLPAIDGFDQRLMAESDVRKLKLAICSEIQPLTGINASKIYKLELREKYFSLILTLIHSLVTQQKVKLNFQ